MRCYKGLHSVQNKVHYIDITATVLFLLKLSARGIFLHSAPGCAACTSGGGGARMDWRRKIKMSNNDKCRMRRLARHVKLMEKRSYEFVKCNMCGSIDRSRHIYIYMRMLWSDDNTTRKL